MDVMNAVNDVSCVFTQVTCDMQLSYDGPYRCVHRKRQRQNHQKIWGFWDPFASDIRVFRHEPYSVRSGNKV